MFMTIAKNKTLMMTRMKIFYGPQHVYMSIILSQDDIVQMHGSIYFVTMRISLTFVFETNLPCGYTLKLHYYQSKMFTDAITSWLTVMEFLFHRGRQICPIVAIKMSSPFLRIRPTELYLPLHFHLCYQYNGCNIWSSIFVPFRAAVIISRFC